MTHRSRKASLGFVCLLASLVLGCAKDVTDYASLRLIVSSEPPLQPGATIAALKLSLRTPDGKKFTIVELPMPKPTFCEGQQLPASYANFLVINGAVLMPTFQQPKRDAEAAEVLAACFPGRTIIPIDCLELVWGLGTLHCISQQQPA